MRDPLIPLGPELLSALNEDTVVTANERQARELKYAFDHQQKQLGLVTWPTANVMSIGHWLHNNYSSLLRGDGSDDPLTIASPQALLLAAKLTAPDSDVETHTSLFLDAWEQYWLWQIQADDLKTTDNGKLFHRWINNLSEFLEIRRTVSEVQLYNLIEGVALTGSLTPTALHSFGLSNRAPAQESLFNTLRSSGFQIEHHASPEVGRGKLALTSFETSSQERAAFAVWSREILSAQPKARIGIVVTDLASDYAPIRRQFEAAYPDVDELVEIVNIGSGLRLSDEPSCRDALDVLRWTIQPLNFLLVDQLQRSEYLPSINTKHGLASWLPHRIDLSEFARREKPPWGQRMHALYTTPIKSSPRSWVERMRAILDIAGWPGNEPDSNDFQAAQTLSEVLDELSSSTQFAEMTWSNAVQAICFLADHQRFAVQSTPAHIQVLSRREADELRFDALWVANASDTKWPGPIRPNPFIPISAQRVAGIPAASQTEWIRKARQQTHSWVSSAPKVVFSYARAEGDSICAPSGLLPIRTESPLDQILRTPALATYGHIWTQQKSGHAVEILQDEEGSMVASDQLIYGGSALLRDQSVCPFKGWAQHRLELSDPRVPHRFPDALDRGSLLHDVLHATLDTCKGQEDVVDIETKTLHEIIERALTKFRPNLSQLVLEYEHQRILDILKHWLDFERSRPPFDIEAVETEKSVQIGSLRLDLRLDRIDRMEDGSQLVIDYKSGSANTAGWRLPRLSEPQLPLYASTIENAAGIALMQLSEERTTLIGVGNQHMPALSSSQKFGFETFKDLANAWNRYLKDIANSFVNGYAAVDPINKTFCRRCHLHGLCRIFDAEN